MWGVHVHRSLYITILNCYPCTSIFMYIFQFIRARQAFTDLIKSTSIISQEPFFLFPVLFKFIKQYFTFV